MTRVTLSSICTRQTITSENEGSILSFVCQTKTKQQTKKVSSSNSENKQTNKQKGCRTETRDRTDLDHRLETLKQVDTEGRGGKLLLFIIQFVDFFASQGVERCVELTQSGLKLRFDKASNGYSLS